jgi:hypothetical protein
MRTALSVLVVCLGLGCGNDIDPKGIFGEKCQITEDCREGLSCLEPGEWITTTCSPGDSVCAKPCTSDAQCADLPGSAKCFRGCSTESVCMRTDEE